MPAGVHLLDHPQLPQPVPCLDLALAPEGRLAGLVPFVPDQTVRIVPGGEAVGADLGPVLMHPPGQIVGRADIERPVAPAGDDVHVEGHATAPGLKPGSPPSRGCTEWITGPGNRRGLQGAATASGRPLCRGLRLRSLAAGHRDRRRGAWAGRRRAARSSAPDGDPGARLDRGPVHQRHGAGRALAHRRPDPRPGAGVGGAQKAILGL